MSLGHYFYKAYLRKHGENSLNKAVNCFRRAIEIRPDYADTEIQSSNGKKQSTVRQVLEKESLVKIMHLEDILIPLRSEQEARQGKRTPSEETYAECLVKYRDLSKQVGIDALAAVLSTERNPFYLCDLGIWFWNMKRYELAYLVYSRAIEIDANPTTLFNLAVCYDDGGEKDKAIKTIEQMNLLSNDSEYLKDAKDGLIRHGRNRLASAIKLPKG